MHVTARFEDFRVRKQIGDMLLHRSNLQMWSNEIIWAIVSHAGLGTKVPHQSCVVLGRSIGLDCSRKCVVSLKQTNCGGSSPCQRTWQSAQFRNRIATRLLPRPSIRCERYPEIVPPCETTAMVWPRW